MGTGFNVDYYLTILLGTFTQKNDLTLTFGLTNGFGGRLGVDPNGGGTGMPPPGGGGGGGIPTPGVGGGGGVGSTEVASPAEELTIGDGEAGDGEAGDVEGCTELPGVTFCGKGKAVDVVETNVFI